MPSQTPSTRITALSTKLDFVYASFEDITLNLSTNLYFLDKWLNLCTMKIKRQDYTCFESYVRADEAELLTSPKS